MGDVLIGVATWGDPTVDPFQDPPSPAVIIRSAEDKPSAGLEDAKEFIEDLLCVRNVLYAFGADQTVERGVSKGQGENRAVDQRVAELPGVAQLMQLNIETDNTRIEGENPAGAAANVKYGLGATRLAGDDPETPPLPAALKGYEAVVRPVVVVG